ncbi:MAG: ornithine carbamoyltransferase [Desulfarculus sp.]|nr:ornithine carbamoyltransferase [Pseudomonadota bacterium]MBV1718287.1 ornithine carbamoyltransferase [Desulfarculus sp.]MBU4575629.1 ornithine carbamoyltransferase [Pseudomonadota bacterium]MBU4597846.1 ornithine carbamoyltransferase [Pseudomonadota bacterium]MBV1738059.1 ornithine carbamoyltransferase [Desulfarculus sp.]
MQLKTRHLLTIRDLDSSEIRDLVRRAAELKAALKGGGHQKSLAGKSVALIFDKPSTRTRVSFEVGVAQLGGKPLFMTSRDSQLGRDEPLKDTARVMSRYVDAMVVRTFGQNVVKDLAHWGSVPVINALTDRYHPCQVLSDLLTVQEHLGRLEGFTYAWLGDGNNMAHSWLEAAAALQLELRLACPPDFMPHEDIVAYAREQGAQITLTHDPREAIAGAQVVNTDVWASMGQEDQAGERRRAFEGFTLDAGLLSLADPAAIVLHCLPAHRGEEISEEVLEGPQSVVWDQAENRLHMQKAIMEALLAPQVS